MFANVVNSRLVFIDWLPMARHKKPQKLRKPELSESLILKWADEFRRVYGVWPKEGCPPQDVPGVNERWRVIDNALRKGVRGLEGNSSLSRLLLEARGVRSAWAMPPYTIKQILIWCDAYFKTHGRWPRQRNWHEEIPGSNGEKWAYVDHALQHGLRGLSGGSSLAQLLSDHRGIRNQGKLPSLTVRQIRRWARDFRAKHGHWPKCRGSGAIDGTNGETWFNIDQVLRKGMRGLPDGLSLARVLRFKTDRVQ
jgi:hypothetical protein